MKKKKMKQPMKYSDKTLQEIFETSQNNNAKIDYRDHLCGCFTCKSIFDSIELKTFTDHGLTVCCPKCNKPTVLWEQPPVGEGGEEYTVCTAVLEQMHDKFVKNEEVD